MVKISAVMLVEFVTESYSIDNPADSSMAVMNWSNLSRSVSLGALMFSLWKVIIIPLNYISFETHPYLSTSRCMGLVLPGLCSCTAA